MYRFLFILLFLTACAGHKDRKCYFIMAADDPKLTVDSFYAATPAAAYDSGSKRYYTHLYAYKWAVQDGETLIAQPKEFDVRNVSGQSILDSVTFQNRSAVDTIYSRFINQQLSSK